MIKRIWSIKAAAENLGITPSAVSGRLFHKKRKLMNIENAGQRFGSGSSPKSFLTLAQLNELRVEMKMKPLTEEKKHVACTTEITRNRKSA